MHKYISIATHLVKITSLARRVHSRRTRGAAPRAPRRTRPMHLRGWRASYFRGCTCLPAKILRRTQQAAHRGSSGRGLLRRPQLAAPRVQAVTLTLAGPVQPRTQPLCPPRPRAAAHRPEWHRRPQRPTRGPRQGQHARRRPRMLLPRGRPPRARDRIPRAPRVQYPAKPQLSAPLHSQRQCARADAPHASPRPATAPCQRKTRRWDAPSPRWSGASARRSK